MYKINLHILQNCNFACKHCFAKFNAKTILDVSTWHTIIQNCEKSINVAAYNIAGGEPLLFPNLISLLDLIKKPISLITNGFLLNDEFIEKIADKFYMIGFSVDSFVDATNIQIGRVCKNKTLSFEQLANLITKIKHQHPDCQIKINTVILNSNHDELMWDKIKSLKVDKWKILKSKKFKSDQFDNSKYLCSTKQFNHFLNKNLGIQIQDLNKATIIQKENIEIVIEPTLKASYLFVDANGCLIDNTQDDNTPIIDFKKEFKTNLLNAKFFDEQIYHSRYSK